MRRLPVSAAAGVVAAFFIVAVGPAAGGDESGLLAAKNVAMSGATDFPSDFGTGLTECPQAGLEGDRPRPLDRRDRDAVERLSNDGDDIRVNQDYSCLPQNETAIAVNPRHPDNLVAGVND